MNTRRRLAAVACAIAGLAVSAPAASAGSWLEPVELDTPVFFDSTRPDPVAAATRGATSSPPGSSTWGAMVGCCLAVGVAYRPAGGLLSVTDDRGQPAGGSARPERRHRLRRQRLRRLGARRHFQRSAVRGASRGRLQVECRRSPRHGAAARRGHRRRGRSSGSATFAWRRKNSSAVYVLPPGCATRRRRRARRGRRGDDGRIGGADVRLPAALATTATGDTTAAWVVRDGSVAGDPIYRLQAARAESGDLGHPRRSRSSRMRNSAGRSPVSSGKHSRSTHRRGRCSSSCASSTR